MAVDIEFVASRLREMRTALAYSLEEISQRSLIPLQRIEEIESGMIKPTGDEVLILASLYRCDFRAFLNKDIPSPTEKPEILFRRYGDSFSNEDRRAVQEFIYLCQVEHYLEEKLEIRTNIFTPSITGNFFKGHGRDAAVKLRLQLKYSEIEVPRNVYTDFREIGIHIFRRRLSNPEISGLYVNDPVAGHCVLINYNEDIYRQRFSVAHEVAHALFDSTDNDGVTLTYHNNSSKYNQQDLKEIRANSFASNYLIPPSFLKKIKIQDTISALNWAQKLRVSTAALAIALKENNLVDDNFTTEIKALRVPKADKIDPEAPKHLAEKQQVQIISFIEQGLSPHYVYLCFDAFDKGIISLGYLADAFLVHNTEVALIANSYGRSLNHGA